MVNSQIAPIVIVYLGVALFLTFLVIRSYQRYKLLKSPTSLYLALFGLFAGGFFYLNSIPLALTTNISILKATTIIGNVFYYIGILMSVRILWHITLKRRIPFLILFIPIFLVIIITFWGWTSSLLSSTSAKVSNGTLVYDIASYPLYLDAIISLIYLIVGGSLIAEMKKTSESGTHFRLLSFGIIYIGAGLIAIYNDLLLHSFNGSYLIYIMYAFFILLFFGFYFFGRHNRAQ